MCNCKTSCSCACKGEPGARGVQGSAGPMGIQGIQGVPGAFSTMESGTFAQLNAKKNAGTLVQGRAYLMTDFQTIYDQPDFDSLGAPKPIINIVTKTSVVIEPLILFAVSINEFSAEVYSTLFPDDKLRYDIDFIATEVKSAPAKGRISERVDSRSNRTDYDHKYILFKRYESAPASGVFNSYKDNGNPSFEFLTFSTDAGSLNNYIGDYAKFHSLWGEPFLLANSVLGQNNYVNIAGLYFINNTLGGGCFSNTFSDGCTRNILGDSCSVNIFSVSCFSNIFGNGCNSNILENLCYSNTFGINCTTNTFGDICFSNTFGDSCVSNTFGDNCNTNTFGNGCFSNVAINYFTLNTFGNGCTSNFFGDNCGTNTLGINCLRNTFANNFATNVFGNDCTANTFGNTCTGNIFGDSCISNTFGNEFIGNIFGNNCYTNTFGTLCAANTFGNLCNTNTFGDYCQSNINFPVNTRRNNFFDNINNIDFAAATLIIGGYTKEIFIRDDGTFQLRYTSNLNGLIYALPNA